MNKQRQTLLGVFFLAALSILAYYTLFLTDSHFFSQPILMTVYFPEANNLREGDPVQLLGARIGRVKEVSPNVTAEPRKRIRTVLSLEREVELLEGATISIRETSLLGGRNVFIDPGPFGGPRVEPLEDGAFFGEVFKNPIASLGDIGVLVSENRAAIKSFLANLDVVMADVRAGKGLLGKLISDEGMGEESRALVTSAKNLAANLDEASQHIKSGQGLLGGLIYDQGFKDKAGSVLDNLQQLSADLRGQQGILGALIYDTALKEKLADGIDSVVAFVKKLDAGDGALPMLMTDKAFKDQLVATLDNLSAAVADVRTLAADTKAGKGTVGKLLTDETLYAEIRKTFGVLTRSLEDYREAAPITSFTSVLFAAF
jgi:phospholipid/cholesterol/gamma-HCH transport system substrate-binding protein